MAKGNDLLKRAHLEMEYTAEQVAELGKCMRDPKYFIKTYVKVQHPVKGVVPFILFDYQEEIIDAIHNNRDVIILAARQTGKTITVSMYLLWMAIFNFDQQILIASKNNRHAIEIMNRIRYAYEELPHWLKPGVVVYNKHSMEFDNRSKIDSEATTEKTGRGLSISKLYLDELAFINPRIQEELWTSLAPTLSTGGGSILSSTPNGDTELFAQLWRQAMSGNVVELEEGDIPYFPVEIPWDRHPERGERFKRNMISKIGEVKWSQEYENQFLSSDALLIDTKVLARLKEKAPERVIREFSFWKENLGGNGKIYTVGVDVASGSGKDYSVIQVFEFPSLEQVAEWRSNELKPHILYDRIKWILNYLTAPDRAGRRAEVFWSFERNGIGHAISSLYAQDLTPNAYAELYSDSDNYGFHITGKSKIISCVQLKSLVEKIRNGMTLNSKHLIFELKNYVAKGGSYEAKAGATDDVVAATLIVVNLIKKISEFDQRAFDQLYAVNEKDYYDPTSETVDEEQEPIPFAIV